MILQKNNFPLFIPQLCSIRFFLAIIIVLHNMSNYKNMGPDFVRNMDFSFLEIALHFPFIVDIFFVLSGFVLFYSYQKIFSKGVTPNNYLDFLRNRLSRLYPLYLISLIFIIILYVTGIWEYTAPGSIYRIETSVNWLLNLSLTNSWGLTQLISNWNDPAWFISVEFFCVLILPVIAMLLIRLKYAAQQIFTLVVILMVYFYLQHTVFNDFMIDHGTGSLIRGVVGMVSGIIMCQLYSNKEIRNLPWDYILLIGIPIYLVLYYWHFMQLTYAPPLALLFIPVPIFILGVASTKTFIQRFLGNYVLVYLGKISFACYILHQPVARLLDYLFDDFYKKIEFIEDAYIHNINLFIIIVIIVLVSIFAHHVIEKPARNWLKVKIKY